MVIYSKAWRKCDSADKRGEESEELKCPKKFGGSSKSMEAGGILKMVEDAFRHICFIIDVILSYYDRTMWDVLNHPSIFDLDQVLESSKGKLDEKISVPYFLADPSYNVKDVSNHGFYIVNYGKSQWCGCTKVDSLRLNKCWGCILKKNRKKLEELLQ